MPEISCSAKKCVYNEDGYCEREEIRIDVEDCDVDNGCTCCDSFEQSIDRKDRSCMNTIGENAGVECFATECIYNENRECIADYISVEGNEADCCTDTFCDTFRTHNSN